MRVALSKSGAIGPAMMGNRTVTCHLCGEAGPYRQMRKHCFHSKLVQFHNAHAISARRASSLAHVTSDAYLPRAGRKPCKRIRMFRPSRLKAQEYHNSLGPHEDQRFSNTEEYDEELYRQAEAEHLHRTSR